MAEQKKANEALNVEEALSQSEAFLIKNKKAITNIPIKPNSSLIIAKIKSV